jgi:hypothetical protein
MRRYQKKDDDPQLVWMVTALNTVAILEIILVASRFLADLLEADRSDFMSSTWILKELSPVFWPLELWIVSIYFSRWAIRQQRPFVAFTVALLPLVSAIIILAIKRYSA